MSDVVIRYRYSALAATDNPGVAPKRVHITGEREQPVNIGRTIPARVEVRIPGRVTMILSPYEARVWADALRGAATAAEAPTWDGPTHVADVREMGQR